jgi:hypothetical protein
MQYILNTINVYGESNSIYFRTVTFKWIFKSTQRRFKNDKVWFNILELSDIIADNFSNLNIENHSDQKLLV